MNMTYHTPFGLRNPHVQTILSSTLRKGRLRRSLREFLAATEEQIIPVAGVKLLVHTNLQPDAPHVLLIPGWLGTSGSSYTQSTAAALYAAGFSTTRINLRDHGGTAHLNPGLFHSAQIDEVIALVQHFAAQSPAGCGLVGYSLGGNFALRVAHALPEIRTLAIAPAIKPAATMRTIDTNLIYQRYFLEKWRKVWREKQAAFPTRYDFTPAMNISTVSALTDYFVSRYTAEFPSTEAYFDAYDLSGSRLDGVDAHILVAQDDPIIPISHFIGLPASLTITTTEHGGHNAFLKDWQMASWVDDYAVKYFQALNAHMS